MPFTLAHAAIAPPLARWTRGRLPASALAIGAMAPDLEYLIFLDTRRTIGHTFVGLVVFCLPLSLVLLAVWQGVVKGPLSQLVPRRWAHLATALRRPLPLDTWAARAGLVVAVLVGSLTHLGLDAFTHIGSSGVTAFPELARPAPIVGRPWHTVLQYASSALGLAVLAVAVLVWARRQPRVPSALPSARHRLTAVTAVLAVAAAGAVAGAAREQASTAPTTKHVLIAGVLGAMAGAGVAVFAYGLGRTLWGAGPEAAPSG